MADNDWTDGLSNAEFPSPPSTSARAAATPRSAGYLPAGKPRAPARGHTRPVRHQRQHAGQQRREHLSLAELQPLTARTATTHRRTLVRRGVRGRSRFPPARPISVGLGQHHRLCRQQDRNPGRETGGTAACGGPRTSRSPGTPSTFNPANITDCNQGRLARLRGWRHLQRVRLARPTTSREGPVLSQLTFFQNDIWSDNVYNGPSIFFAWNQR